MTKLAVCGDSWFSTDLNLPGASFGETLCNKKNWELLDLARSGCSNFAISLQVDRAIKSDSDLIVVGTTTSDRIEIPLITTKNQSVWKKLKQGFSWDNWFDLQAQCFDKDKGLSNVSYHGHKNGSVKNNTDESTIVSESMNNLFAQPNNLLTKEQHNALISYMTHLHDTNLRKQVDSWIISDTCRRLYESGIPFIIFIEALYQNSYNKDIKWVNEENIFRPAELAMWQMERCDSQFHYCPKDTNLIVNKLLPKLLYLLQKGNTNA